MWEHKGTIRRHETTSLVWRHTAKRGYAFESDNVRVIDMNWSKGGRPLREA